MVFYHVSIPLSCMTLQSRLIPFVKTSSLVYCPGLRHFYVASYPPPTPGRKIAIKNVPVTVAAMRQPRVVDSGPELDTN